MQQSIKAAALEFKEKSKNKHITIVSHYDTDGITSAAIIIKTLTKLKKAFSVKIVKHLEQEILDGIRNDFVIFLDLGASFLRRFSRLNKKIFILDHHETLQDVPENVTIVNPGLYNEEEISASSLTYLFCRELIGPNKDLANLAIIGMVGDMLDKEVSRLNNEIIKDAEIKIKRGLLLYPATRPLNKAVELGSGLYIPGVTGNSKGVFDLLSDAGLTKENGTFKSLIDLNEEETSRLVTAIMLRKRDITNIIGNIYLVKFFNKLEDAREVSAMINACSRLENSDIALSFCLNNRKARDKVESIYAKYKQHIIQGLNYVEKNKIEGRGYVIINAKNMIKDTIIGTISSIIASSKIYPDGTLIIGLAYDNEKIKVSARVCGREGRNVREILEQATRGLPKTECGGHPSAAGCLIGINFEKDFLSNLIRTLDLEVVKI